MISPLYLTKEKRGIFNRIKESSHNTILQFIVYLLLLNCGLKVLLVKLYFIEIAAAKENGPR
jgi:hypothetical protein